MMVQVAKLEFFSIFFAGLGHIALHQLVRKRTFAWHALRRLRIQISAAHGCLERQKNTSNSSNSSNSS